MATRESEWPHGPDTPSQPASAPRPPRAGWDGCAPMENLPTVYQEALAAHAPLAARGLDNRYNRQSVLAAQG